MHLNTTCSGMQGDKLQLRNISSKCVQRCEDTADVKLRFVKYDDDDYDNDDDDGDVDDDDDDDDLYHN